MLQITLFLHEICTETVLQEGGAGYQMTCRDISAAQVSRAENLWLFSLAVIPHKRIVGELKGCVSFQVYMRFEIFDS